MKQKQNYKNNRGGGIIDIIIKFIASLILTYIGGYLARGLVKIVTDTEWWKKDVKPRIKKGYNDFEDARDEAIDKLTNKIKKD